MPLTLVSPSPNHGHIRTVFTNLDADPSARVDNRVPSNHMQEYSLAPSTLSPSAEYQPLPKQHSEWSTTDGFIGPSELPYL